MKTITLPAGTLHLDIDDIADYMAYSLWPLKDDSSPGDGLNYGFCYATLKAELAEAVESKELATRDPLTFGPHAQPFGANVRHALVRVDDLRKYVAPRGLLVDVLESEAPAQNTATPAPVVAVVAVEPASDSPAKTKRRTWRDVTETYLVDTFKAEQYPTVKAFYKILERKAGAGSPFDRGIGPNSDSLIAREVCEKVTYKMIETIVTGIRKNL